MCILAIHTFKSKYMKYQVDIKSVLIGFLGAVLIITAFSFKNEEHSENGRFMTSTSTEGVVILDTKTGEYILNTDYSNRGWKKGSFSGTQRIARGN